MISVEDRVDVKRAKSLKTRTTCTDPCLGILTIQAPSTTLKVSVLHKAHTPNSVSTT